MVEHVADVPAFVAGLAGALAQDGLLILSTPNRTALSRLVMIAIGEGTGRIPRGTHDWDKFLTPDEIAALLTRNGMHVIDRAGVVYHPLADEWRQSRDLGVNYMVLAEKPRRS